MVTIIDTAFMVGTLNSLAVQAHDFVKAILELFNHLPNYVHLCYGLFFAVLVSCGIINALR